MINYWSELYRLNLVDNVLNETIFLLEWKTFDQQNFRIVTLCLFKIKVVLNEIMTHFMCLILNIFNSNKTLFLLNFITFVFKYYFCHLYIQCIRVKRTNPSQSLSFPSFYFIVCLYYDHMQTKHLFSWRVPTYWINNIHVFM